MRRRIEQSEPPGNRVFVDRSGWFVIANAGDGRHADAERRLRQAVARKIGLVTTNLAVSFAVMEMARWPG